MKFDFKKAVARYNKIMYDTCREHFTIGEPLSEHTDKWNIRDMVSQCQNEADFEQEKIDYNSCWDADEKYQCRLERDRFLRFVKAYEPFIENVVCVAYHGSKFDNFIFSCCRFYTSKEVDIYPCVPFLLKVERPDYLPTEIIENAKRFDENINNNVFYLEGYVDLNGTICFGDLLYQYGVMQDIAVIPNYIINNEERQLAIDCVVCNEKYSKVCSILEERKNLLMIDQTQQAQAEPDICDE